jgi:hypothetical protein
MSRRIDHGGGWAWSCSTCGESGVSLTSDDNHVCSGAFEHAPRSNWAAWEAKQEDPLHAQARRAQVPCTCRDCSGRY